ncbi:MAG: TIGR03618 family F420-dependent PPOX class oxidoreductase [Acidimicrobiia bacterium]|nr:TIGR03618 family F420-dependent PPOX class oxidoreductase [Acidimicrobiia bacterium]
MEIAEALEYVAANDRAVLATLRRDGSPQQSPVTVAVADGAVVLSTRETAFKVKNLRRDPRAWLCVFPERWLGRWAQLTCRAEITSLPDAMDGLVDYYRQLRGEHPNWDEYRAAMVTDKRCLVRFAVEHAGPDQAG